MPKYSDEINKAMVTRAALLFDFRDEITESVEEEVKHLFGVYKKQRKEMADEERSRRAQVVAEEAAEDGKEAEEPEYFHSGIYFLLESRADPDTGRSNHTIAWRRGRKKDNDPAIVEKRKGKQRLTQYIRATGANGDYSKADLGQALRFYARWELELAYYFERERLRPLRKMLRRSNEVHLLIKRFPFKPDVDLGPAPISI